MQTGQLEMRGEPRVPVICHGTLSVGDNCAPCLIQNMCSRGFLIKAHEDLPVGQFVHLSCELAPQRGIECTVQIRHVNRECLGAKVIEISAAHKLICERFLAEKTAASVRNVA